MKQTLTYNLPIISSTASKMDIDAWDKAVADFDNKNYLSSFYALIDYINPEFRKKYGNTDGTEFSIPHGSILVNIKIEDDLIKVKAPFLSLPEKNRIALLRQAAVLNMNNLILPQIILKDEKLFFEYTCPVSLAEPYKMYYVFDDICMTGDRYDDEFVEKFGASRIYEPKITPYDSQTVDTVYDLIQLSSRECFDALNYFEKERKYGFAWNVLVSTFLKILYTAHPQGLLLSDIKKAVWNLDDEKIPLPEAVSIGKTKLEELQNMPKEKLAECLYFVETFIPPKRRSNLKNIQENFKSTFEKAETSYSQKDDMTVCLTIVHQFYRMYFYNNVQEDINKKIAGALEKTSAKNWENASKILFDTMKDIMNGQLGTSKDTESSSNGTFKKIFSSLFGGNKK